MHENIKKLKLKLKKLKKHPPKYSHCKEKK